MGPVQCMPQKLVSAEADTVVAEPVFLHCYDLGTSCTGRLLNGVLRPLGTGAFHCGVEVYATEWSYCEGGVFCCKPQACGGHTFHESVSMGTTPHPRYVVAWIIEMSKREWPRDGYNVLNHNCCHYCADLCHRLGVGAVPAWVLNLANAGSSMCESECCMQERGMEQQAEVIGVGLDEFEEPEPSARSKSGWKVQKGRAFGEALAARSGTEELEW
mmetsp:Transcript_79533/g.233825  ORF Transcript_79533/g.233825 Transcript_79533/m.233825 type:complete len:215 (+) Transcript_79533:151-795(+)